MKTFAITLFFFTLIHQANAQYKLEVEITDLRSDKGSVMLEAFDANHKTIESKKGTIKGNRSMIVIENLKPGKYAVRYYHDENSNGKLDTNFLGIPHEGYGFSNNAYGNFGPKPFEEWLVEVNKDTKIILITKN